MKLISLAALAIACSLFATGCSFVPWPQQQAAQAQAPAQPIVVVPETRVVHTSTPAPEPRVIYVNNTQPEPRVVTRTVVKKKVKHVHHYDRPGHRYCRTVYRPIIRIQPPRWCPPKRGRGRGGRGGGGRGGHGGGHRGGGGHHGGHGGGSHGEDPPTRTDRKIPARGTRPQPAQEVFALSGN